jgi:hypothetical protein
MVNLNELWMLVQDIKKPRHRKILVSLLLKVLTIWCLIYLIWLFENLLGSGHGNRYQRWKWVYVTILLWIVLASIFISLVAELWNFAKAISSEVLELDNHKIKSNNKRKTIRIPAKFNERWKHKEIKMVMKVNPENDIKEYASGSFIWEQLFSWKAIERLWIEDKLSTADEIEKIINNLWYKNFYNKYIKNCAVWSWNQPLYNWELYPNWHITWFTEDVMLWCKNKEYILLKSPCSILGFCYSKDRDWAGHFWSIRFIKKS